jgi:hypothetical protein
VEIKIKWIPRKQMTHENTYRDDIQIYHVWEGYLRKIPVEREKFPDQNGEGNLVSRLVFFANIPPQNDISVYLHRILFRTLAK